LTYTLINVHGKHRLVPPGQAWKWMVEIEEDTDLQAVFIQIKRKIRDNRLRLANLYEHDPTVAAGRVRPQDFAYKGPIVYDDQIRVHRIIHEHLDNPIPHDSRKSPMDVLGQIRL
jgi:hypothetical protein